MNYAHLIMIVLFQNTLVELGSCLAEKESRSHSRNKII